jgi:hypothetical protein
VREVSGWLVWALMLPVLVVMISTGVPVLMFLAYLAFMPWVVWGWAYGRSKR